MSGTYPEIRVGVAPILFGGFGAQIVRRQFGVPNIPNVVYVDHNLNLIARSELRAHFGRTRRELRKFTFKSRSLSLPGSHLLPQGCPVL